MNKVSTYNYASGNLLEERNTYKYAAYHGDAFFADWRETRARVLQQLPGPEQAPIPQTVRSLPLILEGDIYGTAELLESLMSCLLRGEINGLVGDVLAHLVGRFEVSKRVHTQYLARWRAAPEADYHDMGLYVRYAEIMELAYSVTDKLEHLNVLLKVLDTLSSQVSSLSLNESCRFSRLLDREQVHVNHLLSSC